MTKKKAEASPLEELAKKADEALHLCWQRLGGDDLSEEDIATMVKAWRVKRQAHLEAQELKEMRKEAKESDK